MKAPSLFPMHAHGEMAPETAMGFGVIGGQSVLLVLPREVDAP